MLRVTRAVTLTTESLGSPETAAGTKTLPGMAASAVFDVMTAAMVVLSQPGLGRGSALRWCPSAGFLGGGFSALARAASPGRSCRERGEIARPLRVA